MSVYVRLRAGPEEFAIPVGQVLEVAELGEIASVPGTRPELLGARNLRGQILPVIDLARLLGVAGQAFPGQLVVAEDGARQAAFAVDQVSGVGELGAPTEETVSGLLAGAMLAGGGLIGVIDVPGAFDWLQRASPEAMAHAPPEADP